MSNNANHVNAQTLSQEQIDALIDERVHQAAAKQSRNGALRRIHPDQRAGILRRFQRERFRGATPTAEDIRNLTDGELHALGESVLGLSPNSFLDPRETEPNKAELAAMTADEKLNDVNVRNYLLGLRARREGKR